MKAALAVLVGAFTFVICWLLVANNMRVEWHNHRRLAESGAQGVGTVIAKEPMNHQTVRYEYFVDSTRYSGDGCGFRDPSEFDKTRIGDSIQVTYLPEDPAISVCHDGRGAYLATSGLLFIVVPFGALLF